MGVWFKFSLNRSFPFSPEGQASTLAEGLWRCECCDRTFYEEPKGKRNHFLVWEVSTAKVCFDLDLAEEVLIVLCEGQAPSFVGGRLRCECYDETPCEKSAGDGALFPTIEVLKTSVCLCSQVSLFVLERIARNSTVRILNLSGSGARTHILYLAGGSIDGTSRK